VFVWIRHAKTALSKFCARVDKSRGRRPMDETAPKTARPKSVRPAQVQETGEWGLTETKNITHIGRPPNDAKKPDHRMGPAKAGGQVEGELPDHPTTSRQKLWPPRGSSLLFCTQEIMKTKGAWHPAEEANGRPARAVPCAGTARVVAGVGGGTELDRTSRGTMTLSAKIARA